MVRRTLPFRASIPRRSSLVGGGVLGLGLVSSQIRPSFLSSRFFLFLPSPFLILQLVRCKRTAESRLPVNPPSTSNSVHERLARCIGSRTPESRGILFDVGGAGCLIRSATRDKAWWRIHLESVRMRRRAETGDILCIFTRCSLRTRS